MGQSFLVYGLSIFFGIGTWLCVNGLWVELPLLVRELPEEWNLPSYLAIIIQIANLGPLAYTLLNSLFPKIFTETRSIYFVMVVGLCATILLAQFWEKTTIVFGHEHSTALLVLVFFLASVDCSSRVLYLPFMAKFQESYLTAFFIGEGLSGFIPSIFALIQGVGGNPECHNNTYGNDTIVFTPDPIFSVEIFFYLLFAVTFASAVAFYLLNYTPIVEKALSKQSESPETRGVLLGIADTPFYHSTSNSSTPESARKSDNQRVSNLATITLSTDKIKLEPTQERKPSTPSSYISKPEFIYLLCNQAIVCCLSNGVFPSIQSYSCLPYGNVAYHWTVTLSSIANPAVCFLSFFIPGPTKTSIITMSVGSFLVGIYVMTTAVLSPSPPLVGELSGEILLVVSWILLIGLFTYVKVSIATLLRSEGKRGLFWCGAITQIGSTVGATATFFIVNFADVFEGFYPCS